MSQINNVLKKLGVSKDKYADLIVTGAVSGVPKSEMVCGMTACPFHHWTRVTSSEAIDSTCELPGDGGNILACKPFWADPEREVHYEHKHSNYIAVARLPKCVQVKPISDEARRVLDKEKATRENEKIKKRTAVAGVVIAPDRKAEANYPAFMKHIMWEEKGMMPERYTPDDLKVLSISGSSKIVTGKSVVDTIRQANLFAACLNIHDCVAMSLMGITTFRNLLEFLGVTEIHFWGSTITNYWISEEQRAGELFVLRLRKDEKSLKMEWVSVNELQWFKWCDVVTFKKILPPDLA